MATQRLSPDRAQAPPVWILLLLGGAQEEVVTSGGGEGDSSARDRAGGSMPAGKAQAPKPAQASFATPLLSIGPPVTVGSKRNAGDTGVGV